MPLFLRAVSQGMFCSLPSVMLKELADDEGNISVNLESFVFLDGSLPFIQYCFILSIFKRHSDF